MHAVPGSPLLGRPSVWPRRLLVACAVLVLVVTAVVPADAQSSSAPARRPRGFRGLFGRTPAPDPNRTRTEFSLNGTILGGYSDNLAESDLGTGGGGATPESSGYMGQGQLELSYFRGRAVRSFTLEGSAYGVGYGDSTTGIVKGGSFGISGTTQVRERDRFQVSQRLVFDPLFTLPTLAVLDGIPSLDTPAPDTNVTTGLARRYSWSAESGVDYAWVASRRNTVNLNYAFAARRYPDGADLPGDSNRHRVSTSLARTVNRTLSLQGGYNYSYGGYQDSDGVRPLNEHSISGGPRFEKVLSRTRRLAVSTSIGAQYVRTTTGLALRRTEVDYWEPYGEVAGQFDLSRSWDVTLNYRRGTTVMPEVTAESFVTDALMFGFGGLLGGDRLEVGGSAGLSTGETASAAGGRGQNRTLLLGTHARWAFNRRIGATVNYDYYDYEFTNVGDLPAGLPPGQSRNTVRVGLTVMLPLIGS